MNRSYLAILLTLVLVVPVRANTNKVDVFTDFETGSPGDLVTASKMASGSHTNGNIGAWSVNAPNGTLSLTNINNKDMRGPVIVNTTPYVGTGGIRTYAVENKAHINREYAKFTFASDHPIVSAGFFMKWTSAGVVGDLFDVAALEGSGGNFSDISIESRTPGTSRMGFETQDCGSGSGYKPFNDGTYWFAILYDNTHSVGKLEVYDPSTWLLFFQTNCTLSIAPGDCRSMYIGRYDAHDVGANGVTYYDNLIIDLNGGWPLLPVGATVNAPSTGWTDVSNAVYSVSTNGNHDIYDIVLMAASSNQWTGGLKITNTCMLKGAGTNSNQSVIRFSGTGQAVGLDVSADFTKLRDFQFRGVPGAANNGWGIEINSNNCCISNIYMQDFLSPFVSHSVYGVIYNSHFRNSQRVPGRVQCRGGDANWTTFAPFNGTSDYSKSNFFTIEDCRFTIDSAMDISSPVQVALSSQEGSMWIVRRCFGDFSNTSYQFSPLFDSHGETDPGPLRGNIAIQIYSNVFNVASGIFPEIDKCVDIRGGAALVYSNRVIGVTTQSGVYMRKKDGETADYNNDPVTNVWIFSNLEGTTGNTAMPAVVESNDSSIIVLHTHYETTAPATLYELTYPHPLRRETIVPPAPPGPNPYVLRLRDMRILGH